MDLITHAALGAATAAMSARAPEIRAAAATGAFAGLLPDADVFIAAGTDPLLELEFHRHFTHSFAFLPLGAAVAASIAWLALRRRRAFAPLYGYACLGYLAALLLDACTSYGTHLLWPFSAAPVAWNLIAVLDPLFTLALAVPLLFALVRRRVALARLGVALALGGIALGALQHQRAAGQAAQLAASRGHAPERLLVKPTLANRVLWRSLYLHEGRIHVDAIRVGLSGRVRIYPGASAPLFVIAAEPALPRGSRARRDVERFIAFTDGLPVRHPERPELIGDARYALLPTRIEPLWGVAFDPGAPNAPVRFETLREVSAETRSRFLDMLLGREPKIEAKTRAG